MCLWDHFDPPTHCKGKINHAWRWVVRDDPNQPGGIFPSLSRWHPWPRSQTLQLVRHGPGHRPCNLSGMAQSTDPATCQAWPSPQTLQLVRHGQGHRPCNLSGVAKVTDPATCQAWPWPQTLGQGHRPCNLSGMAKATDSATCQVWPRP